MEISIIPKKYGERLSSEGLKGVPKTYLDNLLSELRDEEISIRVMEANYGKGADWIWILMTIIGIYKIIEVGEKIDKGLNGWIGVAKKIKTLLKQTGVAKLDNDILLLISASEIFKISKKSQELIFVQTI